MAEKSLSSPPYGACYKHVGLPVHSMSLAMSPTPQTPTAIGAPGMGLMATSSNASKFGTVIPSRIFVGGIDFMVSWFAIFYFGYVELGY